MRKGDKIKVITYCHVGDQVVPVASLTEEQKVEFSTKLKCAWLNGLFQGKAKFEVSAEALEAGKAEARRRDAMRRKQPETETEGMYQ